MPPIPTGLPAVPPATLGQAMATACGWSVAGRVEKKNHRVTRSRPTDNHAEENHACL